ncbi:CMRF35-like molecule 1 [Thalassophryne amazonica]|uniref:CMRF35-like molecule 1 n=1 Tax=Thalassophryne amazonica TaxID=390379 RepID=UPI001471F48E|nr:CMRF35-like molecule 1 [Thalassophryne amazonica]
MAPEISVSFLNVPVLLVFWLMSHTVDLLQLSAPAVVTAPEGGSVTVNCQYGHQYREHTKYWCRGPIYKLCHIVVKTPRNCHSDRSSIVDDKRAMVFSVTMTSLRHSDEDKYWCVIARQGINVYTGVRLLVSSTVKTPPPSTATPEYDEISYWATLRWILFILLLCCFVLTNLVLWRINTAQRAWRHKPSEHNNLR